MHHENGRTSRRDDALPPQLVADLRALYGRRLEVPARVDGAVRRAARQRLSAPRARTRWASWVAPFAAAAGIALLVHVGWYLNASPGPVAGERTRSVGVSTVGGHAERPPVVGMVYAATETGIGQPLYPLQAGRRLQTPPERPLALRIWDRHTIRIEPGTHLAAERNAAGGCTIALAAGRITATVRRGPGEGAFRVVTPQASITVTGTVFSADTRFERTCVAVTEGRVMLTTRGGLVQQVAADQSWQTDGIELARLPDSSHGLIKPLLESHCDLATASLERAGFGARFAPLRAFRDHLADTGRHVDDIELLAVSAELWNLQYPKETHPGTAPFAHRRAGLERAARWFGYRLEWLSPADPAEAAEIAAQSLGRNALVLAFGLPGEMVQTIETQDVERLSESTGWHYRFLGEGEAARLPMCRFVPDETAVPDRRELVRQAIEDAKQLRIGIEDKRYWVGARAVEAWSRQWAVEATLDLLDPFPRMLDALANLGPLCEAHWRKHVAPESALRVEPSAYAGLNLAVLDLFTTSALADTPCDAEERTQLVERLHAAFHDVIRPHAGL